MDANYVEGVQSGMIKIEKKIKGVTINYRG